MKYFLLIVLLIVSCTPINTVQEGPAKIDVYFCPHDECQEKIIGLIDRSTDIKCAFYELNLPELIKRLKEKKAEVVIEDSNALEEFYTGYSSALMHNKFCVFDNKTVLTGSMNPTERGNYYNNNNIVIIESKYLADNYLAEFDELKKNNYGEGDKVNYPEIKIGTTLIENYFCPEDNCKLQVINALKKANKSIYFMTYSFTDEDIGNLLWNKNYLGLDIKGILEEKQISQYSRYDDLKEFSILDHNKYTMHHKVFIIDNKTVITGSYNPTENANKRNDENVIIIHNNELASMFISEFNSLYAFQEIIPNITSGLVLSKVLYDAKGSDQGNEYVEITNTGNNDILLDYYFISNNITNTRLQGKLLANESKIVYPKFALRNSEGMLLLKQNHNIIDFVAWEGLWSLEAKEGEMLSRINNKLISEDSWNVTS